MRMSRAMRSQTATTSSRSAGKKASPPVRLRQASEHGRIPVGIVGIEDADGVHQSAGLLRHLQNLGQAVCAGVVAAIADDDQHFLVPAAGLQALLRLRRSRRRAPSCPVAGVFEMARAEFLRSDW